MSTYGYPRLTSPFIDDFAEGSVVFQHARSQASCTFPSVNSLFTSR
jgi:glucan phosphoethanolaminetransferase (alkaline phosphatase superfamily)